MTVEVCLTPALIDQHSLNGKIAVVVDIFRATSCMVAGLSFGISAIYPVSEVEKCLENGKKGMIIAGERGGEKIEGFDIGNSPFDYLNPDFKGREVCVTTTNGTHAIEQAKAAKQILIGSFLNLSATAGYLKNQKKEVLILCAGWRGTPNLEDTLFAGNLISKLQDFTLTGDSGLLALSLYQRHQNELYDISKMSSHAKRLSGMGIERDIEYCMKTDLYEEVMILQGDRVVKT